MRLVTAPASYPVSLAAAKAHLEYEADDRDDLIDGLIAAATDHVEKYTGRALISQTWELVLDRFSDEILINKGPVSSVASVKYMAGTEQTLSASVYAVDLVSDPQRIVLKPGQSWPAVDDGINGVVIRFVCGFATVPAPITQAILLLIWQWFDNRSDAAERPLQSMPHAVDALLSNYRAYAF